MIQKVQKVLNIEKYKIHKMSRKLEILTKYSDQWNTIRTSLKVHEIVFYSKLYYNDQNIMGLKIA